MLSPSQILLTLVEDIFLDDEDAKQDEKGEKRVARIQRRLTALGMKIEDTSPEEAYKRAECHFRGSQSTFSDIIPTSTYNPDVLSTVPKKED